MKNESTRVKQKIHDLLDMLEEKHQIRCLYVIESGSRMWGFSSDVEGDLDKSSDYDVRGVFCYKPETYLGILPYQEQIEHYEYTPKGTLYMDIVLWDIHKFAKLAIKSNPSVYEWVKSPIVYRESGTFMEIFRPLFFSNLCKESLAKHYIGMMIKNFNKYALNRQEVPYKKYLYVLRAAACYYALKKGILPEMHYKDVVTHLPYTFQQIMECMVESKCSDSENKMCASSEEIIALYNELRKTKLMEKTTPFKDVEQLNLLVLSFISP